MSWARLPAAGHTARLVALLATSLALALPSRGAERQPAPPPIDVLLRLKGVDLNSNPAVRAALLRALEATKGTPQFLELVRAFNLKDQSAGLIALAITLPDQSAGAEALQRLIEDGAADAIRQALAGPDAVAIVQALGNVNDESVPALLLPFVADPARPLPLRQATARALVRTEEGATELLKLARAGKVADDLKPVAAAELAGVRWPDIKDEAAKVLPVAAASGSTPALEAVLALRGDAARGEAIYHGAAACAACHQARGKGIDFGPGLSEIGDKFDKQALYAAIVDPNAGISFGYEVWEITLRNGTAFGVIASETDEEIAVKAPGNIISRYRKADVTARKSVPGSIMPTGLLQELGAQQVADLLEYLSSLKKNR